MLCSGRVVPGSARPRSATGTSLLLLAAALLLFTVAIMVPHLAGRDPDAALAKTFGVDPDKRGKVELAVDIERGGRVLTGTAARSVRSGDRLRIRYDGRGYLYLRVVDLRGDGTVHPLVPGPDSTAPAYGIRAEPKGGSVTSSAVVAGSEPLVLYALFAAVPIELDAIELAAREASAKHRDPVAIARGLSFSGVGLVRVLPRD